MSEEKKILCQELNDDINELVIVFPQMFSALMNYQGATEEFHNYCSSIIEKFSDMKVLELVPDKDDEKRHAIKIKFDALINNWEEVIPITKDIDKHLTEVITEMRKRLEMKTGQTQSGIVLPNGMAPGINPEMLRKTH